MKRLTQMIAVVGTGLILLSTPTVLAQESASEMFNEVQNNMDLSHESVHATGTVDFAIANRDMAADVFRFDYDANLAVNPVAIDAEGSFLTALFAFDFEYFVDEADAYFYQNYDEIWSRPTFNPEYYRTYFESYQENYFRPWLIGEDIEPFIDKYVTYSNTDGQHVFQLVSDIDGAEFYFDLDEAVDIEATIISQAEETRELAEEEGANMTDEEFDIYVQQALANVNPENFSRFFEMNPEVQLAYNETSYDLEQVIFNLFIDSSIWEHEVAQNEFFFFPEDIDFTFELNLDNYGEDFELDIPQEALAAPGPVEGEYQY